jgi:hypothetical protein
MLSSAFFNNDSNLLKGDEKNSSTKKSFHLLLNEAPEFLLWTAA